MFESTVYKEGGEEENVLLILILIWQLLIIKIFLLENCCYLFLTRHLMTQRASCRDLSASSMTSLLEPLMRTVTVWPGHAIPVIWKIKQSCMHQYISLLLHTLSQDCSTQYCRCEMQTIFKMVQINGKLLSIWLSFLIRLIYSMLCIDCQRKTRYVQIFCHSHMNWATSLTFYRHVHHLMKQLV